MEKKANTLIGIRFSDNDFYNTLRAFLMLFLNYPRLLEKPENITKKRIADLFNMLAPGLYWLHQNGFTYNLEEPMERIGNYLNISEKNVYLGQECLDFLQEHDFGDNGEFQYVDIDQKQIFCI